MTRPRSVARGVESFAARTPTLPPATHTQSYALGEREVLLVEPATPYEDELAAWVAWARGIASEGRRLVALFVTHHHPDHVGGIEALSRELGLPVWAHEATAARLPAVSIARRLVDGDELVLDGPEPQRWRVLHTPGHAPGHLCLFEPERGAVVVGDMVASEGTILVDPSDGDMARYLAELARLAGLGARVALPAHGAPIDAPEALFRHYIAHRLAREAKVLGAVGAAGPGGAAPIALVPTAYDDTPAFLWPLAVRSLEAHLVKLERDGRVERGARGWRLAAAS
jgi:glyoxylase-like metal-dependent hydrolase (beta-lactamase superfamily II)